MKHKLTLLAAVSLTALAACQPPLTAESSKASGVAAASGVSTSNASAEDLALLQKAQSVFKPLPSLEETKKTYSYTDEQVKLGQQLWYEPRLSLAKDLSCNS